MVIEFFNFSTGVLIAADPELDQGLEIPVYMGDSHCAKGCFKGCPSDSTICSNLRADSLIKLKLNLSLGYVVRHIPFVLLTIVVGGRMSESLIDDLP